MASFQIQNSDVLARLKPFGISFEKSLHDLIKGIRSHSKESEESLSKFLNDAITECKNELLSTDLEIKAMAVLKLVYLEMYGFEMSWCNFQVLEVMSSNKFQQKRIGYLAAIQSFKNEQDLLILATNQFKKDLNSSNPTEIGLALSGIATIVTPNLSKDINDDVILKLNHSKPYIRKKAILAMYKIFLRFPESLKINFNKIIEKLDDSDTSVISATINVICEISKKNPNIFIKYLPKFFTILETTSNNWLIIRILKLFQSLSKVEPRMKKKICPTILSLMLKTHASSLLYECINCIVNGNMLSPDSSKDKETAKFCVEQIMKFFETRDSNLKFVGLLSLISLIKLFPSLLHKVPNVSKTLMNCITDEDLIIKRKALEISQLLVTEDNIASIVQSLLVQLIPKDHSLVPDSFKLEITNKILFIASDDNYMNIPNFRWYIAVLSDLLNLTVIPSASGVFTSVDTADDISSKVGGELKILATRVPSSRHVLFEKIIIPLVQDEKVLKYCPVLLRDIYWIMGEYIEEIGAPVSSSDVESPSADEDTHSIAPLGRLVGIFNALVNHRVDTLLDLTSSQNFPISSLILDIDNPDVLSILVQALVKLFNGIVSAYSNLFVLNGRIQQDKASQLSYFLFKIIKFLENWERHLNYEVQERATSWLEFLRLCLEALTENDYSGIELLEKREVEYYKNLSSSSHIEKTTKSSDETRSFVDDDESDEDSDEEDDEESDEESEEESEDESEDENDEENEQERDEELQENNGTNLVKINNEEDEARVGVEENADYISSDSKRFMNVDETLVVNANESSPHNVNNISFSQGTVSNQDNDYTNENEPSNLDNGYYELPALLTQVLPSFFKCYSLNPISKNAQKNILLPDDIPNDEIEDLQDVTDDISISGVEEDTYLDLLMKKEASYYPEVTSFRNDLMEGDAVSTKKQQRLERMKYDPYYLASDNVEPKPNSRIKDLFKPNFAKSDSPDVLSGSPSIKSMDSLKGLEAHRKRKKSKRPVKERVLILSEETIGNESGDPGDSDAPSVNKSIKAKRDPLKRGSTPFDNFLFNSSTDPLLQEGKSNDSKDIDLEEMRRKLEKASVKKDKTKKSTKNGSHSKKTKSAKMSSNKKDKSHPDNTDPPADESGVVTIKKSKKKKSKAIIE
ncbi:Piso0_004825 [Millerozyma farinosa CBS 7064]|uniref:AP-3 complex subunit delta n=1 Tax=Pichia sorbitophila (strain ATCC MYA-4447 / BCRC 22081 / CBS 7064 / NBRC 10061 / NRRL Y-12695) TaxID=559304 RepID=G8Y3H5_PICSO|nr:Piso0_004825 [Millerozyma farinosa CBS 7064]